MVKRLVAAVASVGLLAGPAVALDPAAVTWGTKPIVWTLRSRTVRPPPPPAVRDPRFGTKPVQWNRPMTFATAPAVHDPRFGTKPVLWTTRAR